MEFTRRTNDSNKLYHYCRSSTALEFILPEFQLLLSPIIQTNDPRENKKLYFAYNTDKEIEKHTKNDLISKHNQIIREDCKVLCFSQDYKNYQGCHLSKMWAQYGENHKGICLEINKDKFIEENSSKIRQDLFKQIKYTTYDFKRPPRQLDINLVQIESIGEKTYLRDHFRKNNLNFLFFTKNEEWESESEMRLLFFSDNLAKEYCSIKNSLEVIHLGIDFNDSDIPAIKNLAQNKDVFKMKFLHEGLVCSQIE